MANLPQQVRDDFKEKVLSRSYKTTICMNLVEEFGNLLLGDEFYHQFEMHQQSEEIAADLKCKTLGEYARFIITSKNATYQDILDLVIEESQNIVCSLEAVTNEVARRDEVTRLQARVDELENALESSKASPTDPVLGIKDGSDTPSQAESSRGDGRKPGPTTIELVVRLLESKWFCFSLVAVLTSALLFSGIVTFQAVIDILRSIFDES